jgi:high-affinity iron transporter
MLGALIIVFREVIEAGIIVGIVMAATRGVRGSRAMAAFGIAAGVIGACLVAAFAGAITSALEGVGQEALNAAILILAVGMLTWHNVWMASHGRELAAQAKQLGDDVRSGRRDLFALAIVIAVAVMREGSEVALFLYGLAASTVGTTGWDLIAGSALGLVAGCALSALTYFGLVAIPARKLFAVTGALITLLAAGLAAQAVAFLQQAGLVNVLTETAWDTSWLISDASLIGRVLHTIIGYADEPSELQVVVYAATILAILTLSKLAAPRARVKAQAAAAQ